MHLKNEERWRNYVEKNKDPYGEACIKVAHRVMEILDEREDFDTHKIICQANDESSVGGITGFMAGCVASMVSECHVRGEEFRQKWNLDNQISDEGKKANEGKGTINPALMTINIP